jgi:hypothetical protein
MTSMTAWTRYTGSLPCSTCFRAAMATSTEVVEDRATWTRIYHGLREFACDAHRNGGST